MRRSECNFWFRRFCDDHMPQVAKNDELSLELLNLANSKNSLTRKQDEYAKSRAIYDEATTELNRVKDLVARLSCQKMKPEEVFVPESERGTFERNLLGNQDQIKEQIEVMKQNYEKQQTAMEERIVKMGKELQEAKRGIRNTQHKLAEQTVALLGSQSQLKEVEMENSQLQLHLKELNEEYRMRLVRYIEDVTDYVDNTVKSGNDNTKPPPADHPCLKRFVDSMLKDIRSAYRSREEQLATAARNYKKRMQNVFKKHEHLLIAYRMQREQILSLGTKDLDPGPSEITFAITDSELLSKQSQELNRLREDKAHLEAKLQDLQEKVRLGRISAPVISSSLPETDGKDANESWSELRRQLREFTFTTQVCNVLPTIEVDGPAKWLIGTRCGASLPGNAGASLALQSAAEIPFTSTRFHLMCQGHMGSERLILWKGTYLSSILSIHICTHRIPTVQKRAIRPIDSALALGKSTQQMLEE